MLSDDKVFFPFTMLMPRCILLGAARQGHLFPATPVCEKSDAEGDYNDGADKNTRVDGLLGAPFWEAGWNYAMK